MASSLQKFESEIRSLYEVDIGDFKRKSLLYLKRFQEQVQSSAVDLWAKKTKELIVCNETVEVDVLRNQIMEQINSLNKKI